MRALTMAGRWLVAVLGLSVLCIVLALAFFNPNARRDDIEAWVSEQTGRRFTLTGELEWRIWPLLAVTLPHARLDPLDQINKSPTGNAGPAFAEWQQARVSVRLGPLLRGRVELGALRLNGLRLRLRRDAAGRDNWQDLLQRFSQQRTPGRFTFSSLTELQMVDAEIGFDDVAAARNTTLHMESLRVTDVAFDQPMGVELKAQVTRRVTSDVRPRQGVLPFALHFYAKTDAALQRWQIDDLRGSARLTAEGLSADSAIRALPMTLRWQHAEGRATQQLIATMLQATVGEAKLSSEQLQLERVNGVPHVSAELQFAVTNLRQWLNSLGVNVPATRDASALRNLSAQVQARGALHDLHLQPVMVQLDQTQARGAAHWHIVDGRQRYLLDLHADRLNLDRYLPMGEAARTAQPPAPLPIEWLRNLQVQGRLRIDTAQWHTIRAQQLIITLDEHGTSEMDGA